MLAGRQKYWHYGIARQYVLALIVALVALVTGIWWLLLAIPLGLLLRVFKSIWSRREGLSVWGLINPLRWIHVLIITLAIDLATFVGWIQAYLPATSRTPMKSQVD